MISELDLDYVFGKSRGLTTRERAANSLRLFIVSEHQIALYNGVGSGVLLTALEAYDLYGFFRLLEAIDKGSAPIERK